jgi:hypothetical protein
VTRWTCPACDREFGRARQSHVCVPGSDCFAGRPPVQRSIYEAVHGYVATLGPVYADLVGVGVFLKRTRTLAEVRPMASAVALYLTLPRRVEHPRITRRMRASADRTVNVVRLHAVSDVDDQVRDWLTEAYQDAG